MPTQITVCLLSAIIAVGTRLSRQLTAVYRRQKEANNGGSSEVNTGGSTSKVDPKDKRTNLLRIHSNFADIDNWIWWNVANYSRFLNRNIFFKQNLLTVNGLRWNRNCTVLPPLTTKSNSPSNRLRVNPQRGIWLSETRTPTRGRELDSEDDCPPSQVTRPRTRETKLSLNLEESAYFCISFWYRKETLWKNL